MYPVVVHLYDLSQGLAKQMSPMLLGKTIDGIWHTGVVVYGKEYFFGGGVQEMDPAAVTAQFGIAPLQAIPMGSTDIPQETFLEYLYSISPRFTAATYDLFRHNCNNFSDEICTFLLGKTIPAYITGLPAEVLSTPMGAMIGQMVGGMQANMGSHAHDPFTSRRRAYGTFTDTPALPVAPTAPAPVVRSPIAPLLSTHSDALPAVARRLASLAPPLFSEDEASVLAAGADAAKRVNSGEAIEYDWLPLSSLLRTALTAWPKDIMVQAYFPALCLLRAVVLQRQAAVYFTTEGGDVLPHLLSVVSTIPPTARVMLFATLSNIAKFEEGVAFLVAPTFVHTLIDAAIPELSGEKSENRLMACAAVFNIVPSLSLTDDTGPSDLAVRLLSAVFEGLDDEADAECVKRRLITAERLLKKGGADLAALASALEFGGVTFRLSGKAALGAAVQAIAADVTALINA